MEAPSLDMAGLSLYDKQQLPETLVTCPPPHSTLPEMSPPWLNRSETVLTSSGARPGRQSALLNGASSTFRVRVPQPGADSGGRESVVRTPASCTGEGV